MILHPSSETVAWANACQELRILHHSGSCQDRGSTRALPEGPLPTQGWGGGAPALPILLSLCFLLSQRSGDIGRLIAFVREVLVKRHCWFRLTMRSPPSRHVILLHIRQLPMWQVRFRVTASPWGREAGCWAVCRASRKGPEGKCAVLGMRLNLWALGLLPSITHLTNLKYQSKLAQSKKSSQL